MKDTYRTISGKAEGIFKDKGSKFLSFAFPVSSVEEIKEIISNLKKQYHDARHHCYAYKLGTKNELYRMNDDGEPSGTAGKPIYGQILSNDLTNVLILVIRYFGGTLLGTSGLINAYRSAATDAIVNSVITVRIIEDLYIVDFDYADMSKVMRIIREENLEQLQPVFDQKCELNLKIRQRDASRITSRLKSIPSLTIVKKEVDNNFMN